MVELGGTVPAVVAIAQRHKQNMTAAMAYLLPPPHHNKQDVQDLALAVNGAITRAHIDGMPKVTVASLKRIQKALLSARQKVR